MASDVIKKLQAIIDAQGDLPVAAVGTHGFVSYVHCDIEPNYWDGGYYAPREDTKGYAASDFVHSRDQGLEFPGLVIKLKAYGPDEGDDLVDGRPLREIITEDFIWLDEHEAAIRNRFDGELPKYRLEKTLDVALGCYPYVAYLESGLEAKGTGSMDSAKKALAQKFKEQKQNG